MRPRQPRDGPLPSASRLPVQRVAALIAAALDCTASEPVTVNGLADIAEILIAAKSMLRRACGLPNF
jgi:hypothetical protein